MTTAPLRKEPTLVGPELYEKMLADFDYGQIIWTMLRYDTSQTTASAQLLLNSFLQWFSLLPTLDGRGTYVMLKTPVEEAFHAFVLNTRLYQEFCERFLGYFFHHDPVTEERAPEMHDGIKYTVELLEQWYGDQLLEPLKLWRRLMDAGEAKIACVGCKTLVQ